MSKCKTMGFCQTAHTKSTSHKPHMETVQMKTIDNIKQIVQDCFPPEVDDPSELIPYIEEHILSGNPKRFIWPADLSSVIVSIYECYDIVGWTVD